VTLGQINAKNVRPRANTILHTVLKFFKSIALASTEEKRAQITVSVTTYYLLYNNTSVSATVPSADETDVVLMCASKQSVVQHVDVVKQIDNKTNY